jgi:hypothetical protein
MKAACCAMLAILVMTTLAPAAFAGDPRPFAAIKITDYTAFSPATVLDENVGRQVEVTVATGAVFKGKLAGVGAQAIHLAELTGKEFFDAVIQKSAIVAVVVRTRDR